MMTRTTTTRANGEQNEEEEEEVGRCKKTRVHYIRFKIPPLFLLLLAIVVVSRNFSILAQVVTILQCDGYYLHMDVTDSRQYSPYVTIYIAKFSVESRAKIELNDFVDIFKREPNEKKNREKTK